jgi:hypothetical protein
VRGLPYSRAMLAYRASPWYLASLMKAGGMGTKLKELVQEMSSLKGMPSLRPEVRKLEPVKRRYT